MSESDLNTIALQLFVIYYYVFSSDIKTYILFSKWNKRLQQNNDLMTQGM